MNHRHVGRIQWPAGPLFINITQMALVLTRDLRRERALPIPRNIDLHLTRGIRDHRLRPRPVPHISRLMIRLDTVPLMPEMLGQLLVESRSTTLLVNNFNKPSGPVNASPCSRAAATIAAAPACSGDNCRPSALLFRGLTRSDAITHRHPMAAGMQVDLVGMGRSGGSSC